MDPPGLVPYTTRCFNSIQYYEQDNYLPAVNNGQSNYRFECSIPRCPFKSRGYVGYQAHVEDFHHCGDCNRFCSDKTRHLCVHPGERFAHFDNRNQNLIGGGTSRSGATYGLSIITSGDSSSAGPSRHICRLSLIDLDIFKESSRSHMGLMVTYMHQPTEEFQDIEYILTELYETIVKLLTQNLAVHTSIEVQLIIVVALDLETIVENETKK